MKLQIRDFLICTLCVLGGSVSAWGEVLAHGTAESYWLVTIRTDEQGQIRSQVQHRPVNSAAPWRTIARVSAPLRQLSHLGRNLVALRENGEWMVLREGSSSTGVVPEDGSRLIHLAGDNQTLWGIGITGMGRRPTTVGATQPAATMPANTRLLYRLERGQWRMLGRLPNEAQDAAVLVLGMLDASMMLAALVDLGRVQTWQYDEVARNWVDMGQIQVPEGVNRLTLLPNLGRATLWAGLRGEPGVLSWRDGQWASPVALALPGDAPADAVQDLTVAGRNSIRMLLEAEAGKITEHSFDRMGAPQGQPVSVPVPAAPPVPEQYEWVTGVAAAALLIVLMNTMRRREPVTPETLTEAGVELAPFGRRIIAGLLDAVPVLGTLTVVIARVDAQDSEAIQAALDAADYTIYIATGVYILHTLVCEMLWGWSIGKRLLKMRVVMVDGTPATARAIILRNLLRILDVMMAFAPLLIVLLSPLRQRVGDVVAETIVVRDDGGAGKDKGSGTET